MNPIRISYVWHTVTGYDWLLHKLIEYDDGKMIVEITAQGEEKNEPRRMESAEQEGACGPREELSGLQD